MIFMPYKEKKGRVGLVVTYILQCLAIAQRVIGVMNRRRLRWVRHVARVVEKNLYMMLVGKPEGKR
jgi:hypothetical protein